MWSYVNVVTLGILMQHTKSSVISSHDGPKSLSCVSDMGCAHKQRCVCMFGISEKIWKACLSSLSVSTAGDKRNTVLTEGEFSQKAGSSFYINTLRLIEF